MLNRLRYYIKILNAKLANPELPLSHISRVLRGKTNITYQTGVVHCVECLNDMKYVAFRGDAVLWLCIVCRLRR